MFPKYAAPEFDLVWALVVEPLEVLSTDKLKIPSKIAPASLRPCAQDGFLLFQVNCLMRFQ